MRGRFPGHLLWAITRDRLAFIRHAVGSCGDVAAFRVGPQWFAVITNPDDIRDVLITNKRNFVKGRALERSKRLLGEGLLTSEGEFHLRQRRLAQPAFHRDRIAEYAETMIACAGQTADRWTEGQEIDCWREMTRLTLAIAGETLFGADVEKDATDVRDAVNEVIALFEVAILPFAEYMDNLPVPWTRRFNRARDRLDQVIYGIIAERRKNGTGRRDLLAMLMEARDEETDGGRMSDEQLRDEMMTLFLAGHETTASALTFTWALLAQHPDVADRMSAELDTVLGGRRPVPADMPRLEYTRRVFAESLRLYPPAWTLGYASIAPHQAGGFTLPARTLVMMPQIIVHHDPRWWPDPETFDPDRFLPERSADRPRFAYFPFGGGVRQCIGEHFAWAEGVLALATIGQRWKLTLPAGTELDVTASFTLRPRGLPHMRITAR